MERLMEERTSIRDAIIRLGWFLQQRWAVLSRTLGAWDWSLLAVLLLSGCALLMLDTQQRQAQMWEARSASAKPAPEMRFAKPDTKAANDDRQRLKAFEELLLPHEDIPMAIESLLRAAEEAGLSIRRAEYRAQPDTSGDFLRYRITLPVQGTAENVNQYLYAALLNQENLALESVQLKRANMNSANLEARIQWSLLTRLPAATEKLP